MSEFKSQRHAGPERVFHWSMAIAVIVCLATAFLPILGFKFAWVDPHWIAGVLLILCILFHLFRVFSALGLSSMAIAREDLTELRAVYDPAFDQETTNKYDLGQKLYHHCTATIILALCVTGGLMLAKLDTWFWDRVPGLFSDFQWGVVYAIHGAAALFLIMTFILHTYFTSLPEHRDLLLSMIRGTKENNKSENQL
jgi:formate dehydrogenase subunit gamma